MNGLSHDQQTFTRFNMTRTWEESSFFSPVMYFKIDNRDYIKMTKIFKTSK